MIEWIERGGPPVEPPTHTGFGSFLIEKGLPQGQVVRRFDPDGVKCTFDLLLPAG